ncbi:MAG: RNA methyltransferase [Candidatus Azobacteroides sp.]|nr:RNA methyltransferase [Candidatus Azobacteroides sp.]
MLSKHEIKYIRSLEMKKFRKEYGVFLAEGGKLVEEIMSGFYCRMLVAGKKWLSEHPAVKADKIFEVAPDDLSRISLLKTPKDVLAVFDCPVYSIETVDPSSKLVLAVDGVQDPGNFGSIVRLADWYGIEDIICSQDTVDVFNPKTVQATMGAVTRVKIHYVSLSGYLSRLSGIPVYGTFLEGDNIYARQLSSFGVIVLGNEGRGIRPDISKLVTSRLFIPNYPEGRETSESLNVAAAGAVICSEFRRRQLILSNVISN